MTSVEAIAAVPFIDGIVYGEGPRWHGDRLWFTDGLAGRVYSAGAAGDLAVEVELARASGLVAPEVLFDTFAAGSAASFALSHHGQKALLPDDHPTGVFSTDYMGKDVSYALEAGVAAGVDMPGARLALELLQRASALGLGENYHTAVVRVIEAGEDRA